MIIGPLLMKSVNEYDLSEQLKFQTNELNCSIISGSHVLSKVKKNHSRMKLFVKKYDKYSGYVAYIKKNPNLIYLTDITQGKNSKWFKVTNSRISRGMFIKNQKGR